MIANTTFLKTRALSEAKWGFSIEDESGDSVWAADIGINYGRNFGPPHHVPSWYIASRPVFSLDMKRMSILHTWHI